MAVPHAHLCSGFDVNDMSLVLYGKLAPKVGYLARLAAEDPVSDPDGGNSATEHKHEYHSPLNSTAVISWLF